MNSFLKDCIGEKKLCPYKEKCYRKNPVHFNEMSHPHLEKLIVNQLDGIITIPDDVGFQCSNRLQLMDQLKVLQMVLRKNKDSCKESHSSKKNLNSTHKIVPSCSANTQDLKDLKDKIEKHKQAALHRRQNKLKEMDDKALSLADESKRDTLKRKLSSPDITGTKLTITNLEKNDTETQINSSLSELNSQNLSFESFNHSSSTEKSHIEKFVLSTDRVMREKIRDNAILKMKEAGHKISLSTPGEFALKYALSAPYHFFLNRVEKSNITHNQEFSVSFTELLDISLGEIVDSLHINFMVEIGWLCLQYLLAAQNPKMTIFCGSVCDPQTSLPDNINLVVVNMPTAYGCHHSKVSVFKYKDNGIRIIVSTANIYTDDWENRTQGIWISPHLRKLPDTANPSDGDSPTNFKKHFREYLTAYKHPQLVKWEHLIKRADFSDVNVFFFASIPGSHKGLNLNSWGHRRLGTILSEHAVLPPDAPEWKLLAQCSSIGSLGPNYESWVLTNIVESMSKEKQRGIKSNPDFQLIYPTLKNYKDSFDCQSSSCCLPYSRKNHEKQQWLTNYLCQWKADVNNRTKAMPHIKTYTRISPDQTKIPWFVLTSANLSKGAWGSIAKTGISHYIMNYEAGVVFIPKFIINETVFPIKTSSSPDIPIFRLPYDLPLTKYQSSDIPFVIDFLSDE